MSRLRAIGPLAWLAWPAWVTCLAALGGCAALPPALQSLPVAAAPQLQLTIAAPPEQQRLLQTYLDIARLAVLAPDEALSDTELRRLAAATPAQARALLATQGYMDPVVTVRREPGVAGAVPQVRIEVERGTRSRIESAELELTGPLAQAAASGDAAARETLADWRDAWSLPAGRDFSDSAWRDAKTAALARLRAAGYASASWGQTSAQVDADRARVVVAVTADSGPLFRTGEIVVEGLQRQAQASVLNMAGFGPGTPATEALLLDYQERLQRAGLYERVAVTLAGDTASTDASTVLVRLTELPLQQATVGIGISATNGVRVSAEHVHRRAFGLPALLRNKLEVGSLRQAWDGELQSHTLPGLNRNLIGGAVERLDSDTGRVSSVRLRVGRSYDTQRLERLAFVEFERAVVQPFDATALTNQATPDTTAATVNFHATWRGVDSVILPTDGESLLLQTALGRVRSSQGGPGGGGFARWHGRLQAWRPLGGNWYGQARIELGQVLAAASVSVPETQRFRAGGDDSVRGYAFRSLSPSVGGVDVGGRVVATASVEVSRPLLDSLPSLWGAAFIDGGNAAERWGNWRAAWGAGLGLRWRSPVGPLRADVAYGEQVKRWRLHLSVGIVF